MQLTERVAQAVLGMDVGKRLTPEQAMSIASRAVEMVGPIEDREELAYQLAKTARAFAKEAAC